RKPNYSDFVEWTVGFMDALGVERAALIGNSMGGMIATKTALLYPSRVTSLALVNSAGFGREVVWWLRARTVITIDPPKDPPPWLVRRALQEGFYDPDVVHGDFLEAMLGIGNDPDSVRAYRDVIRMGMNVF